MNIVKTIKCLWWYITTGNKCDKDTPPGMFLDPMEPSNWEIGPIMGRTNYSKNMPLHPTKHPDGGWYFDIPHPTNDAGSAHYITMQVGSLANLKKITMNYRLEMDPATKLVPCKFPDAPSIITLYFQRKDDHWTADYESCRWYASFSSQSPIEAGEHVIEAAFDQNWTAVLTSSRQNNPDGYLAALSNPRRIGFVLGGGDGLGHGVYATGPARLVVTSFQVE